MQTIATYSVGSITIVLMINIGKSFALFSLISLPFIYAVVVYIMLPHV